MDISWKPEAGRKPGKGLLEEASTMARVGSNDHVVIAMALRAKGVTQNEVVALFGHPHRNKIRSLIRDKRVRVLTLPDGSRARRIRLITR